MQIYEIWPLFLLLTLLVLTCAVVFRQRRGRGNSVAETQVSQFSLVPRRILVVTLETRDLRVATIHDDNVEEYCQRRGYTYRRLKSWSSELPVYWQKVEVVLAALSEGLWDYVVWLDSDTYIVQDRPLEELFASCKDIFIGEDRPLGIGWNCWCAGVFAVKNSSEGRQFLRDVLSRLLNNPACRDENGKPDIKGYWGGECYEQGVMNNLLFTAYKESFTGWESSLVYNTNICDGRTFILHLFGKNKEKAYRCFTALKEARSRL